MSTKVSEFYSEKLDVHIFREQTDNNYYLETDFGTVLMSEKMAKELAKKLRKIPKRYSE